MAPFFSGHGVIGSHNVCWKTLHVTAVLFILLLYIGLLICETAQQPSVKCMPEVWPYDHRHHDTLTRQFCLSLPIFSGGIHFRCSTSKGQRSRSQSCIKWPPIATLSILCRKSGLQSPITLSRVFSVSLDLVVSVHPQYRFGQQHR